MKKNWDPRNGVQKFKNYVGEHVHEIVMASIVVGGIVTIAIIGALDQNLKDEDKDPEDRVEDALPTEELVGYDIWAIMNGDDSKVVEFAPKLEEFCKENEITIMCDMMD